MAEITTGNELLQYRGDAALAGGEGGNALGFAQADFTPLQNFALKAYEVNETNARLQRKDLQDLEDMMEDPSIRLPLDENLASQIRPKLEEMKQLMLQNPHTSKDRGLMQKYKDTYQSAVTDNKRLKAVQATLDKAREFMGKEEDPQRKSNLERYVKKLEKYKLGQDIPVYDEWELFDPKDVAEGQSSTVKYQRLNGNNIDEIEITDRSVLGLDKVQRIMADKNGKVMNTEKYLANSLSSQFYPGANGETINPDLTNFNKLTEQTKKNALQTELAKLDVFYRANDPKYLEFLKQRMPSTGQGKFSATGQQQGDMLAYVSDYLQSIGKGKDVQGSELNKIYQGLAYLDKKVLPVPAMDGENLERFHYFIDPVTGQRLRFNVDNNTLLAQLAAQQSGHGRSEKVVSSKPTDLGAKIKNIEGDTKNDAAKTRAEVGLKGSAAALNRAKTRKVNLESKNLESIFASGDWDKVENHVVGLNGLTGVNLKSSPIGQGGGMLPVTDSLPSSYFPKEYLMKNNIPITGDKVGVRYVSDGKGMFKLLMIGDENNSITEDVFNVETAKSKLKSMGKGEQVAEPEQ